MDGMSVTGLADVGEFVFGAFVTMNGAKLGSKEGSTDGSVVNFD
jgi:hypothetical protein